MGKANNGRKALPQEFDEAPAASSACLGPPARPVLALAMWLGWQAMAAAAPPSPQQSVKPRVDQNVSPAQRGSSEWGWVSSWAADVPGGVRHGDFWAVHLRWGRVLTPPHGPAFLRGSLEYAVEIVPVMLLRQSTTVFGGGLTPFLLQYNFTGGRRIVPFIQAGGGMLFTTREVPAGTSQFNFTPQGGVGLYFFRWPRSAVVFGVRYHHISNAGRAARNPGLNSLYIHTGISWWR